MPDIAVETAPTAVGEVNTTVSITIEEVNTHEAGNENSVSDNDVAPPQHSIPPQVEIDTQDGTAESVGTINSGYTPDYLENQLPVVIDIAEQYRLRYKTEPDSKDVETNTCTQSECTLDEQCSSHVLEGPKTCSCNCHNSVDGQMNRTFVVSESNHSERLNSFNPYEHDKGCTGSSCNSTYRIKNDCESVKTNSNSSSPSTRFGRKLSATLLKIYNANGGTPPSGRSPPNYRSLIFSILQDEPPKYEDVTGKKLATELIGCTTETIVTSTRTPTFKSRVAGVGIFIGVIIVTVLLLYLSVTGAGSRNPK